MKPTMKRTRTVKPKVNADGEVVSRKPRMVKSKPEPVHLPPPPIAAPEPEVIDSLVFEPTELVLVPEPKVKPKTPKKTLPRTRSSMAKSLPQSDEVSKYRSTSPKLKGEKGSDSKKAVAKIDYEKVSNKSKAPLPIINPNFGTFPLSGSNISNDDLVPDYEPSVLDNKLLSLGYTPIRKVGTEDRIMYVKAYNSKGEAVYIDLEGLIIKDDKDSHRNPAFTMASNMIEMELGGTNNISQAYKMGAYLAAEKEVSGVVFEYTGGLSVVARRPNEIKPYELNLTQQESTNEITTPIPYPLVRLVEIEANPRLVLKNTDLVIRRIRNSTFNAANADVNKAIQSANELKESLNKFYLIKGEASKALNESLTELEKLNNIYENNPHVINGDERNKKSYDTVQYNLILRSEAIITLIRAMKKIAEKGREIERIVQEVKELNEFCEREFENMDRAVPR
jgi:hypothetical protein